MLRATLLAVLAGACLQLGPVQARSADPIPPVAPWLSDAEALALLPAAVGTQGWETPLGEHRVLFKAVDPVWRHPGTGALVPPGGRNPLGSRWIAFYQDCSNPGGWDGEKVVQVRGCSHVGLHGTPPPLDRRTGRVAWMCSPL